MTVFACLRLATLIQSQTIRLAAISLLSVVALSTAAKAQITPDNTLGDENSTVTPDAIVRGDLADLIEGGAARGGNLFHSFLAFNVAEGQRVYFANPGGIESILSRVTGGDLSNIFGVLGVDGAADLFLLNPNGIVFGENATLDIAGSFYATTAAAIELGDEVFSATEPEKSTLLTVAPSVFFSNYLTDTSGSINNQGRLGVGENVTLAANQLDLQGIIAAGSSLTLLATNNISVEGIIAAGSNLTLLATNDISMVNSGINTLDLDEQGISDENLLIQGNNISIVDSVISTSSQNEQGNIILIADKTVEIRATENNIAVLNSSVDGEGTAGDISIAAANLRVIDNDSQTEVGDATLLAVGRDSGNGGNITINVSDTVFLDGGDVATITVGDEKAGTAGDIQITATHLEILNGSGLQASTSVDTEGAESGDAGDVTVEVHGVLRLNGFGQTERDILPSQINASTLNRGSGKSGNIHIVAGNIDMDDGSFVSNTTGIGGAGDIQVTATQLQLSNGASINSSTTGNGQAGNITLDIGGTASFKGGSLDGQNSSGLFSRTFGEGRGGDIRISTINLAVTNGARLSTLASGSGQAGNIVLEIADTARFVGVDPVDGTASAALSSIGPDGEGRGGNVEIRANTLELLAGAQLITTTFGIGEAGDIILEITDTARFVGSNLILDNARSGAFSGIEPRGEGRGGDIKIRAANLEVLQEAALFADSLGIGNAGNIILLVSDQILVDDGVIGTNSENDSGGLVNIQAGSVILRNDGDIQTFVARGEGEGGKITLLADFVIALEDSDILAFSPDGRGGAIDLSQTTLFSQNLNLASENLSREELLALDGNDQVDINATGGIESGQISINDASFIENSLNELFGNLVNTETITAGSCITRTGDTEGSFVVTGGEGLPQQPGGSAISVYPTSAIQTMPETDANQTIQEPEGIFQLIDGRLVLSHKCD